MPAPQAPEHRVSILVGGMRIDGWESYEISSNMVTPADAFTLTRPFLAEAYQLCRLDAEVTILIDDTPIITGRIDSRDKDTSRESNQITITGRDKIGRLVKESAPHIGYDGLDLGDVVAQLATPWFRSVSFSDARNRKVRLGTKGRKAAAANEDIVIKVKKKTWQVEPGQLRWKVINDLCREAGYMVWGSTDGKELIIGQPNYGQGVQYLFANPAEEELSMPSTCFKMKISESIADMYSMIIALGSGAGDSVNYGESTVSRRGVVFDGGGVDGVGANFIEPCRLVLVERTLLNAEEAEQHAQNEMDRRRFKLRTATVTAPAHGQIIGSSGVTLFAPNTIARVVDSEANVDGRWLIFGCTYKCSRAKGETTDLQLVPSGTVFVQ